ncbi:uncharacterized protein TM35_000391190 [Trypanosoma theileri]|uniref:methylated diphthine methylhydrolase n=1 Tax=Trypanosoma theileri TaxID=67003 RepID=A0A1X0NJL9_9TRYP|nr:uncharacterized protein TM35_000391190 [Trypanosoma theileri]ORC84945.1 hypothetical protein TM35_000391190 [Trypanosoma theileri]
MVSARKVAELSTVSTCNCLLADCSTVYGNKVDFIAGCYELILDSDGSVDMGYRGSVNGYALEHENTNKYSLNKVTSTTTDSVTDILPGIFDLTCCSDGVHLMTSCTDGAVRLFGFEEGFLKESVYPVHNTMLTSCSPFYLSGGEMVTKAKWLCTAHQGAVLVYDAITMNVVCNLEGHDYDAWCSATIDTEISLSGGDDGLLKWWDLRSDSKAIRKMQFGAGVVSIAPVTEGGVATTLSLVGSYDEHLYIVDSRLPKEPLTSINLGGGVWRCSRQLFREGLPSESKTSMEHYGWVHPSNVLAIPVMQRGVALVSYNINASEENMTTLLGYLHNEKNHSEEDGLPENALFYDSAVLHRGFTCDTNTDIHDDTATVVTCDFYNKKVALWNVEGILPPA